MSRTRFATYPLLGLMLACGAQASPPPAAARSNQPNPSAGICGGFERRALADKPISLLDGRLSIRPLEGSIDAARLADVMSASPSNETETRLFLRDGESKFVVMSIEIGATAGSDMLARVRASDPRLAGARFEAITLANGMRGVLAVEQKLAGEAEAIPVAHAFTELPDQMLQVTRVFVNPEVLKRGGDGCAQLATRVLTTLAPGERRLELGAGERKLGKDLVLSVPAATWVYAETGPDFVVYRLVSVRPLGDPQPQMGIYVGSHPHFSTPSDAKQAKGKLLGQDVVWYETSVRGGLHRETLVKVGEQSVHVFLAAPPAELAELVRVAETLRAQRPGQ